MILRFFVSQHGTHSAQLLKWLLVCSLLLPLLMQTIPVSALDGCDPQILAPRVSQEWTPSVVELMNRERRILGRPPLKISDALTQSALYHVIDMLEDDYFHLETHDRVNGELEFVCWKFDRITNYYPDHVQHNSILNQGFYSGDYDSFVVNSWMNSDFTRGILTYTEYWEVGVAYYNEGNANQIWVADFGRQPDSYPVIINDEARETDNRWVMLYIYSDSEQGADWEEVRLRNNNGEWSDWMAFETEMLWLLDNEIGEQKVYAQMRADDVTAASNDTIMLTAVSTAVGMNNQTATAATMPMLIWSVVIFVGLTAVVLPCYRAI